MTVSNETTSVSEVLAYVKEHNKAILAALIAFLTGLTSGAHTDGISTDEWLTSLLAGLIALGGIGALPNGQPSTQALTRRIRRKMKKAGLPPMRDPATEPAPPLAEPELGGHGDPSGGAVGDSHLTDWEKAHGMDGK